MVARTVLLPKVVQAAQWLEAQNALVMQEGFVLQTVTVDVQPEDDNDPVNAAHATFTWQGDHYSFTVA